MGFKSRRHATPTTRCSTLLCPCALWHISCAARFNTWVPDLTTPTPLIRPSCSLHYHSITACLTCLPDQYQTERLTTPMAAYASLLSLYLQLPSTLPLSDTACLTCLPCSAPPMARHTTCQPWLSPAPSQRSAPLPRAQQQPLTTALPRLPLPPGPQAGTPPAP